jgi:hypothetical protein
MSNPFKPEASSKTDGHVTNPYLLADSHAPESKHQASAAEKSGIKSNGDKLIAQNTDAPKQPEGVVKWESDDPNARWNQMLNKDGKPKVIIMKLVGCAPCKQLQDATLTDLEKTYGDKINFYEVTVGDAKEDAANAKIEKWANSNGGIRYPHLWFFNPDLKTGLPATEGNQAQEVKDKVARLLSNLDK